MESMLSPSNSIVESSTNKMVANLFETFDISFTYKIKGAAGTRGNDLRVVGREGACRGDWRSASR